MMEFHTYQVVDEIGNARVLECRRVDWPAKELLEMEAVDIQSYREAFQSDLAEQSVPLSPQEVNPLAPVSFQYRTRPDGDVQSVMGIVIADEVGALVRFAEQNLVHADNNQAINGYLETERDAFRPRGERRSRLMTQLDQKPNDRNKPYRASPLLHRPIKSWNSMESVSHQNDTYEMHTRSRDGKRFLFISRLCLEYFVPRNINANARRIDQDTGKRQANFRFDPLTYKPFYYTRPGDGHSASDADSRKNRLNHIFGVSRRSNQEIECYRWASGVECGVVASTDHCPLSLLESLDKRGRQIHRPNDIGTPIPLSFIEPEWLLDVDTASLNQALSTTIEENNLNHPLFNDGHLDRRWYVQDQRTTVGPTKFNDRDNDSDKEMDSVQMVNDPETLAYILQRTKNGLYDPDHRAKPTSVEDLGMSRLTFSLGET